MTEGPGQRSGISRLRNLFGKDVFVTRRAEVDQDQLASQVFYHPNESTFAWQEHPRFLRANGFTGFQQVSRAHRFSLPRVELTRCEFLGSNQSDVVPSFFRRPPHKK